MSKEPFLSLPALDNGTEETREPTTYTLEDLLKVTSTEPAKLWHPILPQVGLAGEIGSSDTGKSCFARQLLLCIVEGKTEFLGFLLSVRHRQAIYVTTEDDEEDTAFAYRRMFKAMDCKNTAGLRIVFDQEDLLKVLDKLLTEQPADVVVIDAYLDIAPPDSNQASQTRQLLHQYSTLARRHKTLILFVHHTGKASKNQGPSKHGAVGSQSWEAKLRTVFELRSDTHNPNVKHLSIVKGNSISQAFKTASFVLEFDEDTLSFTNTGQRVSFEELAKDASAKPGKQSKFDPDSITEAQHINWIDHVFATDIELKRSQLVERLTSLTGKGKNAIEKQDGILNYYLDKEWIVKADYGKYRKPTPF